jgi:hypothetical protein
MSAYIKNLETLKIELHFEKSDYMAMSENDKQKLKSAFLWSNYGKCWVSRAKEPNLYRAIKTAKELGFTEEEKRGERISFAEQMERKAERAEARAERYEEYAENAKKRAEGLQAELNSYRGDTAFFTQPIIVGHTGSQAFAKRRERIFERYRKGFDEYRKSEYFQDRAETARATADMKQLKNPVYLHNRIKECNANIRALERAMVRAEEQNNNEDRQNNLLEKMEYEIDKLAYLENCLEEIGGNKFSKDNIKVGYVVKMRRWGRCEIVGTGPVNVTFRILDGGAAGGCLTEPYAAIEAILQEKEAPKIENPYKAGDILCHYSMGGNRIIRAYQVVKATAKGVSMQEIEIENGIPQAGQFKAGSKPMRKGITINKFNNQPCIYCDGWQLYKYVEKSV